MSDTPRTDNAMQQIACFADHPAVLCLTDLARQLERELAEANLTLRLIGEKEPLPNEEMRLRECKEAPSEADGWAVVMADGPFVGIWRDREIAESLCAKQPPSHKDRVEPMVFASRERYVACPGATPAQLAEVMQEADQLASQRNLITLKCGAETGWIVDQAITALRALNAVTAEGKP